MTETITTKRRTYAQPCWRAYNVSQVHERAYVERLLTALCAGLVQPPRRAGRGRKPLPIADLVFAVVLKVFLAMSNRRAQSDLRDSVARGNVRTVGHFNEISKFLAEPDSTEIAAYRRPEASAECQSAPCRSHPVPSPLHLIRSVCTFFDAGRS